MLALESTPKGLLPRNCIDSPKLIGLLNQAKAKDQERS
jgi:hypothetical protein